MSKEEKFAWGETPRRTMPDRRHGFRHKLSIVLPPTAAGKKQRAKVYLSIGWLDEENRIPGELFIEMDKTGSSNRAWVESFARMISLGLQHGIKPAAYARMLTGVSFQPSGPVKGYPPIRFCKSTIDLIGQFLHYEFVEGYVHTNEPEPPPDDNPAVTGPRPSTLDKGGGAGNEVEGESSVGAGADKAL